MSNSVIKVLIVDDHAIVREGVKQILADTSDFAVVGEAESGFEILKKIEVARPDVIVLDISMPKSPGLDILGSVKRHHPKLPIVVLSMHREKEYGPRLLRAGADGYVMKDAAPAQLISALRKVCTGGKFVSEELAEHLAGALEAGQHALPPHERLSDREYAVFRLIGQGKAVKEVADELSLSVKTVSTYRARTLMKTGLNNNAEIVRYCIERDLA